MRLHIVILTAIGVVLPLSNQTYAEESLSRSPGSTAGVDDLNLCTLMAEGH